jgi:hypothetical protein
MSHVEPLRQWPDPPDGYPTAWIEIGKRCSAGRRSLWTRQITTERNGNGEIIGFELCAGREGGDDFVRVMNYNKQFKELLAVLETAEFAATT